MSIGTTKPTSEIRGADAKVSVASVTEGNGEALLTSDQTAEEKLDTIILILRDIRDLLVHITS